MDPTVEKTQKERGRRKDRKKVKREAVDAKFQNQNQTKAEAEAAGVPRIQAVAHTKLQAKYSAKSLRKK